MLNRDSCAGARNSKELTNSRVRKQLRNIHNRRGGWPRQLRYADAARPAGTADADLVLGFQTVLNVVEPWLGNAEVRPMAYRDQEQVLEYAEGQVKQGKKCVVCCWGDLNVSARELLERVRRRADSVELVQGISSVQIAMSRTGISLEDSVFITLHKRADAAGELDELVHYINEGRGGMSFFCPAPST